MQEGCSNCDGGIGPGDFAELEKRAGHDLPVRDEEIPAQRWFRAK
jgi:hypothetical protein